MKVYPSLHITASSEPTVSQGASGNAVTQLQEALANAGFSPGSVDGQFGPKTLAAVKAFQKAHGLTQDGVVGPKTWAALAQANNAASPAPAANGEPTLSEGASGAAVKTLQQDLAQDGFSPGTIDGQFGANTLKAVEAFQKSRGLSVDGVVGAQTWAALTSAAPAKASTPATTSHPTLSSGASGWAVKTLQQALASAGFSPGTIDGQFGPKTLAAVKAFQKSRGLTQDGIVGPQTWSALTSAAPAKPASPAPSSSHPTLYEGASGAAVTQMQQLLTNLGYSTGGVDGQFGPKTLSAVKAFQRAQGLADDGICGPATWSKLLNAKPPAPAPASGSSASQPTVQYGSSGAAVTKLQQLLTSAGFSPGGVDGIFGANTQSAVMSYQWSRGLTMDGIVGPKTWAALLSNAPAVRSGPPPANAGSWSPNSSGKLYGADTSSWQSQATFEQSIAGAQYAMIKASEGTSFVDPTFASRWAELGQKVASGQMKLRVAYEFLQPGNGTAQANHFLATLGINGPLPAGTRLCLDWEASALNDPQALADAANRIHQVTGIWPLIYTSGSQVARAKAAVPNAPIWEAKWGGSVPTDVPFVQYSDGPGYDHDVFNGNLATLEQFAGW